MVNFRFKMKNVYKGIHRDMPIPNNIDHAISLENVSCESSCPPLNPIEKSKYNEMNLDELGGISKSLFKYTATIPRIKNSSAGLVKFSRSKLKFIVVLENCFLGLKVFALLHDNREYDELIFYC
jgi:hypothetical protein